MASTRSDCDPCTSGVFLFSLSPPLPLTPSDSHVTSQKRTLLSGVRTCRLPKFLHQASASSRQSAQFAQLCCHTVTSGTARYTAYRRNPQPPDFFTPEYKEVRKCAHKVQNMARSLNITPSTAHHIFCPRLFAKNAGVHATWQTLLSGSTQTGKCRQRSAEPANTKFHEYSFQRFSARCRPINTIPTLLQTLSSNVLKSCNWNKSSYTR